MTPDVHHIGNTKTEIRKEFENGRWKVVVRQNKEFIKETYCLSEEHAEVIKGEYKNICWSYKLN